MIKDPFYIALALMALSVVAVTALRRAHLPPILAYLLVGVMVGPYAMDWLHADHTIHLMAEIGVVFLLFSIGLEFSWRQLVAMRAAVLGLGTAQVVLTTLLGLWLAHLLGMSWQAALIIGGAVALSSTAIVAKQLNEQLEMQSRHGRLALGALLFQDLAVVPFLVMIPILASGDNSAMGSELLFALLKGVIAFGIMIVMGRWVLRPVFHTVAGAHSTELFTLTVLLVALAAAATTHAMGLSLALGAFLAGIMLSETEYRHQIETDIQPFRDVLMGLFFITIGMQLNIMALPKIWLPTLLFLLILVPLKGVLVMAIARIMGHENGVALRTAVVLAQGGEFGFALMALALNRGLINNDDSQAILTAVVISMALAPLLIRENGNLAKRLFAGSYVKQRHRRVKNLFHASRELRGHVIVVGYGRIGQNLIHFLRQEHIPYVALDLDPVLVREAYEAGDRAFYGDATHISILRAAGIMRARALVLTNTEGHVSERIICAARLRNTDIPIIVRTQDDMAMERLEQAGASRVVPERVESSMMLASHLLQELDVPTEEILELVEKARQDNYHKLRSYFHGMDPETPEQAHKSPYHQHSVVLSEGCPSIGKRLGELTLNDLGVTVVSIRRGHIRGEDPSPKTVLRKGDALVLEGTADALEEAEKRVFR